MLNIGLAVFSECEAKILRFAGECAVNRYKRIPDVNTLCSLTDHCTVYSKEQ